VKSCSCTDHIIYVVTCLSGGLPPEARRKQAELFSAADSGFDVLVASDAIGMGLNLAIRRIVFSSLEKFDGRKRRKLFPYVSVGVLHSIRAPQMHPVNYSFDSYPFECHRK
jgi:ATP-dependent RNA helicase SUPV3L1/SUV3